MTPERHALEVPSRRKLAVTTAISIGAALLLLFTAVLPAEYGIDPLGTGSLLGLKAISQQQPEAVLPPSSGNVYTPLVRGPVASYSGAYKTDYAQFTLGPYEFLEYKYRLEKGAEMIYSWTSSAPVKHDFHGEPAGGGAKNAVSFDNNSRREAHGMFTAPFSGIHGWYWENTAGESIVVSIRSAGFYSSATEFRMDRTRRAHPLTDLSATR